MPENTEWEVVDAPASDTRSDRQAGTPSGNQAGMKALLGPYWKIKVAALAVAGVAVLVLLAMIAGIVVLALAGAALLMIAIAKIRSLFHQPRKSAAHPPADYRGSDRSPF